MRIIEKGNKFFELKPKTFQCRECGCVFEADSDEYHIYNDYNDCKTYYGIKCPCCGYTIVETIRATPLCLDDLFLTNITTKDNE